MGLAAEAAEQEAVIERKADHGWRLAANTVDLIEAPRSQDLERGVGEIVIE